MKIGKLTLKIQQILLASSSASSKKYTSSYTSSSSNSEYYYVARLSKSKFTSNAQKSLVLGFEETFVSEITFNCFLFWTIYLDLYRKSKFLSDSHVGRAEIRIKEAFSQGNFSEFWYWLHKKTNSPSSYSIWHQYHHDLPAVGQIKLALRLEEYTLGESPNLSLSSHSDESSSCLNEEEEEISIASSVSTSSSSSSFNQLLQLEYRFEEQLAKFTTKVPGAIGFLFPSDVAQLIKSLQELVFLFGQGIHQSALRMLFGYFFLSKFHDSQAFHQHTGEIVEVGDALHLLGEMRIFWRFCLCSLGWRGLGLCGKTGNGILTDIYRQDSIGAIVGYLGKHYKGFTSDSILQMEVDSCKEHFRPSYLLIREGEVLILSIRGTLDVTDTNIDLACEYVPWRGGFVHEGILQAARWFLKHLYPDIIEQMTMHSLSEFWITGHSLGAATGSMFRILLGEHLKCCSLQEQNLLRTIKCICFGCPPVISDSLLPLAHECGIVNVVNEYDVVCRLSYGTVMDFREMLLCATQISTGIDVFSTTTSFSAKETKKSTKEEGISKKIASKMSILHECRKVLQANPQRNAKLHIPGTIYHIYSSEQSATTPSSSKEQVKYFVEKSDSNLFQELIMRKNSFKSHLPSRYDEAIEGILISCIAEPSNT